ncbi:hypothetical protein LCGC14_1604440 [marine sediment metagenome]|uniref:Uncharacterized protein n=1 Tax=marine sediment metagenome TaxID=412755 RepID=A0A0F9KR18_9ZZZZ
MSPRLALALDTIIWVSATAALAIFVSTPLAILVGLIGVLYLSWCVVVMIRIMKVEQMMHRSGEGFGNFDGE